MKTCLKVIFMFGVFSSIVFGQNIVAEPAPESPHGEQLRFAKSAVQPPPVILASIKPLALIAQSVLGEHFHVETLLPTSTSPHHYALKFSDIDIIHKAELVLWIGPELEAPLLKPIQEKLKQRPETALQVGLIPGVSWATKLPVQQVKSVEHDHGHSFNRDPHLWLNPDNAVQIADALVQYASRRHPAIEQQLISRLQMFKTDIDDFKESSKLRMSALKEQGFVVMHDGYQHLVSFYHLKQVGSVQKGSGIQQGLKYRYGLLQKKDQIQCVLTEPQWPTETAEKLAKLLKAKTVVIDPMGQNVAAVEKPYIGFMKALIQSFETCLKPAASVVTSVSS